MVCWNSILSQLTDQKYIQDFDKNLIWGNLKQWGTAFGWSLLLQTLLLDVCGSAEYASASKFLNLTMKTLEWGTEGFSVKTKYVRTTFLMPEIWQVSREQCSGFRDSQQYSNHISGISDEALIYYYLIIFTFDILTSSTSLIFLCQLSTDRFMLNDL